MNRGKASASPPVQLTGSVPPRNIQQYSTPPRGQTPPFREEYQSPSYQPPSYTLQPTYIHGGIQSGLPHDINKSAVQQQSPRMPEGPTVQIMYAQQGHRQINPQSMQGSLYGQPQANARAARPQLPMGMQGQMYQMYMPQTAGYPGAPTPQLHMVPNTSPYVNYAQAQPSHRMTAALPHYPVANPQTNQQYQMGPNPNTPPYYNAPNSNASVFFSQTPAMSQPQRPPSASAIPQTYQKRERTVLKIVDPNTGKDIMEDITGGGTAKQSPQPSGASSARATPVSPNSTPSPAPSEIGAQFAAQVAARLSEPPARQPQPLLQQIPPQMGISMPPPHVQYPAKPEGPTEGMTVQMPPKVPSPGQYQRSSVTPPQPQMMPPPPPQHVAVQPPGGVPAQFVVHPGAPGPAQTYKPPPSHPIQTPPPPQQQPQVPAPQVQEPIVVVTSPQADSVITDSQDIRLESVSKVTADVSIGKGEVTQVTSVHPGAPAEPKTITEVSVEKQKMPKDSTVSETPPSSIPVSKVETVDVVKQSEVTIKEKTDSIESDSKPAACTDSSSGNRGDVAPPSNSKTDATISATKMSDKSETRTIIKVAEPVQTIPPPEVKVEVKPPPVDTEPEVTSKTGAVESVKESIPVVEAPVIAEPVKPSPAPTVINNRVNPEEAKSVEVKAVEKPKAKTRGKDLNAKGETKEGSDMDLFTEPETKIQGKDVNTKEDTKEVSDVEVSVDTNAKKTDVEIKTETSAEVVEPVVKPIVKEVETVTPKPVETPPTIMTSEEEKETKVEVDNRVVEENEKNEVKSNEDKEEEITLENSSTSESKSADQKYQYKEDQWSPLNPEGKKQYDRAFLLTLQYSSESVVKPEGLPNLPDVVLNEPHAKETQQPQRSFDSSSFRNESRGGGGGGFDFTPGYVRPSPRGGSSSMGGGGKNRSQQGGRKEIKKIISSISIGQDTKLHHAENAWKPQTTKKDDENPLKNATQELYRNVTSILNKLTPQKFQKLVQQMTDLSIDTEERLKGVIDLVFEKAVSEPGFCVAYANMCKYLMMLKVPVEGKPGATVNFRKLLLLQCQREFDKDNKEEVEYMRKTKEIEQAEESLRKQMREVLEIEATMARRRSLGNIRFIGELFKLKMLTENIMHGCVVKLLKSHDEESLECLCRLLSTIGKELDSDEARLRVDQYFQQMSKIVSQKKTSSRVRFMLQDVVDLRLNRWVPRREDNNPKTIDQIHKEVAKEDAEKLAMIQNVSTHQHQPMNRGGRGGRERDRERGGRPHGGNVEEGWSTVGIRAGRATIDPTKLKLSKQQHVDENIQLGPGRSFASWGRGSSAGSSSTNSKEPSERPNTPGNRFSALSSRGEDYDPRSRGRGRGISPARSDMRGDMRSRTSSSRDPPRSKQGVRSSMEMERQNALATVKSHSSSGRSTPPSREASRENSRSRDPRQEIKAPPPANKMSDEEIERKAKALLDEYLHIKDGKEAENCIAEFSTPINKCRFVAAALNHVIERSDVARKQTGNLLHDVVKKKLISIDSYLDGLKEVLTIAEDCEIDIPRIWKYLGELIGPMVHDGCLPLKYLKHVCDPLKPNNKAGVLVAEILHEAASRLGHLKIGEYWKASDLKWSDFLPESVNVQQFIQDKKLEFTLAEEAPKSPTLTMDQIHSQLEALLIKTKSDNEEVFDWIEGNVDEEKVRSSRFIRTLVSLVCTSAIQGPSLSCKVDEVLMKKRGVLLQKYLDHQADLELQALFALQALANKLEYPSGLLRSFFEILYDEDIISEDAFNQWEESKDPAEQEGKGVALKQVVQFFTWLQEDTGETPEDS